MSLRHPSLLALLLTTLLLGAAACGETELDEKEREDPSAPGDPGEPGDPGNGAPRPARAVVLDGLAGTASALHLNDRLEAEVGRWTVGEAPNEVRVQGDRALVVNSMSHTLQLLDLAEDRTLQEVFLGDNTNPFSAAWIDEGLAAVSLLLSDQIAFVDLDAGEILAEVDLPTGARHAFEGMTPLARPQHLVPTGEGALLVALTGLDAEWQPATHGHLALVEIDAALADPEAYEPELIHLAEMPPAETADEAVCLNASYIALEADTAYVSCAGAFGEGNAALAQVDLRTRQMDEVTPLGGMSGRVAIAHDRVYLAGSHDGHVLVTDLAGQPIHDAADPLVLCPSDPGAEIFQTISGLLPLPGERLLASCFATSEVLDLRYAPGAEGAEGARHVEVHDRIFVGDGADDLALWGDPPPERTE